MAIDKILPGRLNADSDERLLENGFMSDAMNITLSEDGKGTASIAKNMKGTVKADPLNDSDNPVNNKRVRGIGSVGDPQKGFVYFVVADNDESGEEHAIYQYNTSTDKYRLVIKDSRFNFDPRGFVKLDVVNGDFARNGGNQTILFFTDGKNSPKKINVDRALLGEYSPDMTDRDFDYTFSCIKAPSVHTPEALFTTDPNLDTNSFRDEAFQFATQLIYKDGEESAISGYSNLAIPSQLTLFNLSDSGTGIGPNIDNVCIVKPNVNASDLKSGSHVSKLRILARSGNLGPFQIVDEFPINEVLTRNINGEDVQVYNGSNEYRFFNEKLARFASDLEVNKLYDNVPFEATGQAIVGNRLMYSNYTEGRPNTNVNANLDVVYRTSDVGLGNLIDPNLDVTDFVQSSSGETEITILLSDLMGFTTPEQLGTTITAGTKLVFEFDFGALFSAGQEIAMSAEFDSVALYSNDPFGIAVGAINLDPSSFDVQLDTMRIQQISSGGAIHDGILGGFLMGADSSVDLGTSIGPNAINTLEELAGVLGGIGNLPKYTVSVVAPNDMAFSGSDTSFVNLVAETITGSSFEIICHATFFGTASATNIQGTQDANFSIENIPLTYRSDIAGVGDEAQETNSAPIAGATRVTFQLNAVANSVGDIDVQMVPFNIAPISVENLRPMLGPIADPSLGIFIFAGGGGTDSPLEPFVGTTINPSPLDVTGGAVFDSETELYTPVPGLSFMSNEQLTVTTSSEVFGFKAGALHNLGVVYYDRFNRSGFVNEIGTCYVEWFGKDGDDFRGNKQEPETYKDGPAAIEIDITSSTPSWAETYQIVYPGNSSVSDFIQYTVGNAFPARVKHDDEIDANFPNRNIDTESKRLYVALETLDQYREERNTFRDYSFTEGDKLRVISFKSEIGSAVDTDTTEEQLIDNYKSASDGSIIEFDVVAVELLAKDRDNPIAYKEDTGDGVVIMGSFDDIADHMTGKFLVLEATAIATGAFGENGNILKYQGFDWNHVSRYYRSTTQNQGSGALNEDDFDYVNANGEIPSASNGWRAKCLVEIFTPKKSVENEFYYEIGKRKNIQRAPSGSEQHGGSFVIDSGDINYRPVPCKAAFFNKDATSIANVFDSKYSLYEYSDRPIENFTISEKLGEKMWSRGRPHVKFENAATFRRFNAVTYSDAFAEDVDRFSLTSFNPGTANFYSFDSQYGACNYISNYGTEQQGYDELVAIQENKFSKTPVNKSIITDAAGSTNVALSTDVLRTTTYYAGDYGCGNHPESVLVQDNDVYFFDRSRQKVLRFAGGQLTAISDQGVSSLVDDAIELFNKIYDRNSGRIVSGYDPDDQVYYITFVPAQQLGYQSGAVIEDDQGGGDEDAGGGATDNPPLLVPLYFNPDLDGSGQISSPDILQLIGAFGTNVDSSFPVYESDGNGNFTQTLLSTPDFNFDGEVSSPDILLLLGVYGTFVDTFVNTVDGDTYTAEGTTELSLDGQPLFFDIENQVVAFEDGTPVSGSGSFLTEETTGNALRNLNLLGDDLAASAIEFLAEEGYIGFTLSYNSAGRFWQSRNSFYPDVYANQDNSMYTVKYVNDDTFPELPIGFPLLMHKHADNDEENNRCQFYDQNTSQSFIEVVSNTQPSTVKVYDAVSQEVTNGVMNCSIESSDGSRSIIGVQKFSEREGTFYAQVGRDISANSTSHIRVLGLVEQTIEGTAEDTGQHFLRLYDYPNGIIEGAELKYFVNGALENIGVGDTVVTVGNEVINSGYDATVRISSAAIPLSNQVVVMVLPKDLNGDSVRGHFTKIKMSSTNNNKYELFCVNAHYTPSNLNHV